MSDGTNQVEALRDTDGTLHVECRFSFTEAEMIAADLSPSDWVFLQYFDRPDASLADRLQALSILVEAKERSVSGRIRTHR